MSKMTLTIGLVFFLGAPSVSAVSSGEASNDLENLAKTLKKTKLELRAKEKAQRQVMGKLFDLNKKIENMAEKKNKATDKVLGAKSRVKKMAKKIAKLEKKVAKQKKGLSRRLRALYMLSGQETMRILFSSTNSNQLDRNMKFLKLTAERDYELIKNYKKNMKKITRKKSKLQNKVKNLISNRKQLDKKQKRLTEKQKSKSQLLSKLRRVHKEYRRKVRKLRQKAPDIAIQEVDPRLRKWIEPSFFERKGRMSHPVNGRVVTSYGLKEHKDYDYHIIHKGLSFSTPADAEVEGVHSGQVVFANALPGYGKTVIINHGDHYYTVYAKNAQLNVERGDHVDQGHVIAKAGSSQGPDFYFEIRHFSEAVDPRPWLRSQEKMKSQHQL